MKIRKKLHFTLVELMVTISVFMFFIIILTAFFSSANKLWMLTEKNTEVVTQAQTVLDTIDRLFAGAQVSASKMPLVFDADLTANASRSDQKNTGLAITPLQYKQNDTDDVPDKQFENGAMAIFATVSDMEIGKKAASNFYFVSVMRTVDDKLKLRTISDDYLSQNNNMQTLLENTKREDLLKLFREDEKDWAKERGHLTLELAPNITRFVIYPAVLVDSTKDTFTEERKKQLGLQIMAPGDPDKWPDEFKGKSIYAVKVEISLLSNDDYKVWRQLWPERTKGTANSYAEPDAAKNFRSLHEKTFSRIIYIGPKKEVQAP